MITLLLLPALGALALFAIPRRLAWFGSLTLAAATLLAAATVPVDAVERYRWLPSLGAQLLFVNDGISYLLIVLTALMTLLGLLASPAQPRLFHAMLLLLSAGCHGVFLSRDLLVFFICFEAVLIPMYFLIGIYGAEDRRRAALKFFLFTLAGSIALLLGILTLYFEHARHTGLFTFEFAPLLATPLPLSLERIVFWAFFLGFAIKIPMFPFHSWLPDAHTQAPTAASVLLAAVLLKMGTYGFVRFSLPLLPRASLDSSLLLALSVFAILYGGWLCLAQTDWKRLIAYSSISHLGFCTLGIFSLNAPGLTGALLQQINHGISTGLLFLLMGFAYDRRHTRLIADYGGLSKSMPGFAAVFMVALLGSIGLPLLNGFTGEFTILRGAFAAQPLAAALALIGIILAAGYMLSLYRHTMLGAVRHPVNLTLPDLNPREWLIVTPLLVWSVAIGIYPAPYFALLSRPVEQILERLHP